MVNRFMMLTFRINNSAVLAFAFLSSGDDCDIELDLRELKDVSRADWY